MKRNLNEIIKAFDEWYRSSDSTYASDADEYRISKIAFSTGYTKAVLKYSEPTTRLKQLGQYISDDDVNLSEMDFLRMVRDRISDDLAILAGSPELPNADDIPY